MSIEVMKQALEALEKHGTFYLRHEHAYKKAITALREAIAEAEKQGPVGYVSESGKGAYLLVGVDLEDDTPLYAAPVHASDEFKEMVEKGTKAWADTPDDWVDDLRGGVEKREHEPVAWIVDGEIKVRLDMAGKLYFSETNVYGKDVVNKAIESGRIVG
jgi:hypothetical protein